MLIGHSETAVFPRPEKPDQKIEAGHDITHIVACRAGADTCLAPPVRAGSLHALNQVARQTKVALQVCSDLPGARRDASVVVELEGLDEHARHNQRGGDGTVCLDVVGHRADEVEATCMVLRQAHRLYESAKGCARDVAGAVALTDAAPKNCHSNKLLLWLWLWLWL